MIRVGQGIDVHTLVDGRDLVLGGVHIPHTKGLLGHSDADVLIHAICDALLGAAGLGDIGRHFPDDDKQYKDRDSREFLRAIAVKLKTQCYYVINIDSTIIAQTPRLSSFIPAMTENVASDLNIDKKSINIKATTTEGLGLIGAGEGIAAMAVAGIDEMAGK